MKRQVWCFLITLVVLVAVLAACATPTPRVIEKEVVVEKPVVETVVVEKEVPVEVEKVVEKIVEKVVTVVPKPLKEVARRVIQAFLVPLCWLFNDEFVVIAVAIELGYYEEAGFPLVVPVSGGGSTGFDPIVAINGFDDNVRIGIQASMAEVIKAYAAGVDVVAVGALLQDEPCSFMTLITEDRRAQTPCDFKGRVVAMQSEATWYVELLGGLCSEEPLELGKDFTWIPAGWTPDCLMADQCDFYCCWATNQPFMLAQQGLVEGEDYEMFLVADFLPFYYGDVIVTTRSYLERHPEKVEAFVQATMKAAQYVLDHPDEAVEIASRIEGVDPAHAEWRIPIQNELVTNEDTEAHGIGWMNPEKVQEMVDFLAENGQIDHTFDASEVVDNSFITGP